MTWHRRRLLQLELEARPEGWTATEPGTDAVGFGPTPAAAVVDYGERVLASQGRAAEEAGG